MELDDRQYKRVARWLDGESVELTDAERSVAEEICRADLRLAGAFEVAPTRRATERAVRRLTAALAARPSRFTRFARPAAGIAAAIVLALAAAYLLLPPRPVLQPTPSTVSAYPETDVDLQDGGNIDLDLIGLELDALAADMIQAEPVSTLEAGIDSLQQRLDGFWLEEADYWPDEI